MSERKTLLIIGAAGFVGGGLVRALAREQEWNLVAADLSVPGDAQRIDGSNVCWEPLDVTDRSAVAELLLAHSVSHVIYGAALTWSPEEERASPVPIIDVNLGGLINLLAAAGRAPPLEQIIFLSSSGLYAQEVSNSGTAVDETHPLDLSNYYAATKRSGEILLSVARHYSGHPHVSLRLASVYGAEETPTASRPGVSVMAQLADALSQGKKIRLYGPGVVRDWVHIEDVAAAVRSVLDCPSLAWDIYNVSSGVGTPFEELVESFVAAGLQVQWVSDPDQADIAMTSDAQRTPLAIDRLVEQTGFRPAHTINNLRPTTST